ncbi:lactose-binding lectin l-2-like [Brachyistius frenatus]|uniref:lactose-binding lectin l-2-like n=1 Tax=Brachyistius frenatus TaxID=100188 RepID=UPI0037E828EA
MILFLFLFGLALGAASPPEEHALRLQRNNCPMFWYSFNGRCYKYVSTHTSWADAEIYCRSVGTNLVSIHSLEEENFVNFLIKNFDPAQGYSWVGLSDIHKEGAWMWSDGSAVDFTFWSPGEPNNSIKTEHCVHSNGIELKWNDRPCSQTLPSVCATRIDCSSN